MYHFFARTICFVVLPPYLCPKQKEESLWEADGRIAAVAGHYRQTGREETLCSPMILSWSFFPEAARWK